MREVLRLHILLVLLLQPALFTGWKTRLGRDDTYQRVDDYSSQQEIQINVYPHEHNIRDGRDAVFDCRARTSDGMTYPEVRWSRSGGVLPSSAYESTGRLTISGASVTDSGRYVCAAVHNGRTYEASVQLNVQTYGPQEFQGVLPTSSGVCQADERVCGNNECVKTDYVCDGEPDCRDRSDEQNCPALRSCEPNEFQCNNGRCVQKMWLCDKDDDCGDNSDELMCDHRSPVDGCSASEFRCRDGRQCVPISFHCDGTNDCQDGSDEVGCVQPTIVEPPETNKIVAPGDTFKLTCRAVAVPEPYINWRLNWGPVCDPPRCVQQSQGGLGTLIINNAQPLDQGAYTCEAINVKGRVLATPDCIVRIVSIPAPTAPPSQIRCDPIGSLSPHAYGDQCRCKPYTTGRSCDQCTPGAFHLHEKAPQGCLKCFCFGITDQCRSSSWYRSKDKLLFSGDSQGVTLSDMDERDVETNTRFEYNIPGMLTVLGGGDRTRYWRMPLRFLGNKVSAYGGEMNFELQYSCSGTLSSEPLVIIKGNGMTLVHRKRDHSQVFAPDAPIRISTGTYEVNFEHVDGRPASREHLMMVLADIDAFLIRATHCDGLRSTSLGDVSWEIAVDRDTQDRLALEVEQCSCPPGYIGLSCEDCAPGYERSTQGPYLGVCVPAQPRLQCSPAGAVSPQPSYRGTCQCKTYASGKYCDQCPPNSFYMAASNPQGCIPCFCSGVTQRCSSSSYSRVAVEIDYSRGARDQLQISTSDAHSPFVPQSQPVIANGEIAFSQFYEASSQTLYWKLPQQFLGNKVTSYGGILKYVFRYSGTGPLNTDADVILRGNDITLIYKNRQQTYPDRDNVVEVKLFEDRWQRVDGQSVTREHLLMTLADLDAILIKMTYLDECSASSIIKVSFEYAEPRHTGGMIAYEVEQCVCPPGYVGTSCEDCAPGYSRIGGGLYLGICERCDCHGHASQCDKEHGYCIDCQHNTEGDQCERCKSGFVGDARRGTPYDCQPAATRPPCSCNNHSPRGCDSYGRCLLCEHNTEGYHCEQCKKGFYGDATRGTPYDCKPCPCPGASDCFLDQYGQVQCRNCPAGLTGRICDECAPGYTRSRVQGGRICEPIGRVEETNVVFVPTPEVSPLRVQIDYPKDLRISPGGIAQWHCRVMGHRAPNIRLKWSKVGALSLPDNAIQTNGDLIVKDVSEIDSGQYRCTATGPHQFATDDATLTVALQPIRPPMTFGRPPNLMVDPLSQTVNENDPATFRCWVPGLQSCELTWHKEHLGGSLPYGVYQSVGVLKIPRAQLKDAGNYICTASNEFGMSQSQPVKLIVNRPVVPPRVDPKEQTVGDGDPVRFRCWVPGDPTVRLTWKMRDGRPLPPGVQENEGILSFPRVSQAHVGEYVCSASDPEGKHPPVDSPPARLNMLQPPVGPVVEPREQTVSENDPARFSCWVPDNPEARLRWSRQDHAHLPYGSSDDGNGVLYIPKSAQSDIGAYICSVIDPQTDPPIQSEPVILHVNPPARAHHAPEVDPLTQSVAEGYPSQIRCYVPGLPSAVLRWRKHNGDLPEDSIDNRGVLYIPRTSIKDAGDYICSTEEGVESVPAKIIVGPKARYSRPQVDPPEQSVHIGQPSQIKCFVPGSPSAVVHWRKHHGDLPSDATEDHGTLHIVSTDVEDGGNYICSTEDPETGTPFDSDPARIDVIKQGTPQVDPPYQQVPEGEPSSIRCWVSEDPYAQLEWRKKDGYMSSEAVDDRGLLKIAHTRQSDAGDYICSMLNPSGEPSADSPPARIDVKQSMAPQVDPPEQTVNEGDPSQLRCWVPGNPSAKLQWSKRGGVLPAENEESHGVLRIMRTNSADAGDYICTAMKPDGTNPVQSSPARINVQKSTLTPIVDPQYQSVNEGDPARFHCYIPGQRSSNLKWSFQKPGNPLPPGVKDEQGVLTFERSDISHDGEYICTNEAPEGHTSSPPATLRVNRNGQPPRPSASPADQTVKPGEQARFHCDANSDSPARISWGFGTADGPLRGDVIQAEDEVVINSADVSSAGEYICTATNQYGSGTAEPVRLHLAEDEQPPTARVVPRVWNGQPGDRHQFRCITTGMPPPQVTWTGPNGTPLPEDVVDIGGGILDFSNGHSELNGDYTCTAVNIIGEASDHGSVNIGPSLTVKTIPPGPRIVLTAGEPLDVKCEAFGEPEPEVEWLHDPGPERGDLPDDFKPVTISEQFIRHPNIGLGNAGVYTCKGSNSHASATKDIYVEVVEASRIATVAILGGSTQWFEPGDPAELVCTATGSSLVDRLQWVRVNGQLSPDVEDHNEPGILHFARFKSSDSGEYECRGFRNEELIATGRVRIYPTNGGPIEATRVEIDEPHVRVVRQGDSIVLSCSVQGHDNGGLRYEWALLRGGSLIRQFSQEQILNIKKADPTNDYGIYRCEVEDENGELLGAAYAAVTIGYPDSSNAHIVKFDEKAEATISCPVYVVPGAEIKWEKEDDNLPDNSVSSRNKLIIKDFDDRATGLYICKVNIDGHEVEGYVRAQIYVPDTIIQVLLEASSESVAIGDRAWFDCKVTGDPDAEIVWTKEGDELPENAQVTGNRLLFVNVQEENGGIYKCHAKTKAGPLETRTVLNVGSLKRKRKHLHTKKQIRAHRTGKKNHSIFGSWFKSA